MGTRTSGEIVDRIGRKMLDVIDKYSKENGFAGSFRHIGAEHSRGLRRQEHRYHTGHRRLFDQANPVKGGAATPKPATPRPAASAPPKPQQ